MAWIDDLLANRSGALVLAAALLPLGCDAPDDEEEASDAELQSEDISDHDDDDANHDHDDDAHDDDADHDHEDEPEDDADHDEPEEDEPEEDEPEEDEPEEDESNACDEIGAQQDCEEGRQFCDDFEGGLEWGPCLAEEDIWCEPGETSPCEVPDLDIYGEDYCYLSEGVPQPDSDCNTPLVISFDNTPVEFAPAGSASFDIVGDGACTTHDWPTETTPWLALDLDKNGSIDGGHELFGSGTRLSEGSLAKNGFAALAQLDANGDGLITAADPVYADLVLWSDYDRDRASTFWELEPLASRGVESIDLASEDRPACDGRGNCARDRSAATMAMGSTAKSASVIDVYLSCQ